MEKTKFHIIGTVLVNSIQTRLTLIWVHFIPSTAKFDSAIKIPLSCPFRDSKETKHPYAVTFITVMSMSIYTTWILLLLLKYIFYPFSHVLETHSEHIQRQWQPAPCCPQALSYMQSKKQLAFNCSAAIYPFIGKLSAAHLQD